MRFLRDFVKIKTSVLLCRCPCLRDLLIGLGCEPETGSLPFAECSL